MFVVKLQLLKSHYHGNMIHFKHQGAILIKGRISKLIFVQYIKTHFQLLLKAHFVKDSKQWQLKIKYMELINSFTNYSKKTLTAPLKLLEHLQSL